jgi:hypothetical protein
VGQSRWLDPRSSADPHSACYSRGGLIALYDDLVAKRDRSPRRRTGEAAPKAKAAGRPRDKASKGPEERAQKAIDLVRETIEALYAERGDTAKLWGSMVKQTLKRRQPSFNESFYGFGSFNELLEEAQARDQLKVEMDERSGGYVILSITRPS